MIRLIVLAAAFLVAFASSVTAAPGVLVLFSDERVIPAHGEFEGAFRADLGLPGADIEYSAEFLDSTRFTGPDVDALWRDFLRRKYAGHDIRAIVVAAPPALDFMLKYQPELFPGRPVVGAAVSSSALEARRLPSNFIVISFTYEFARTVEVARQLQPWAREIVVAVGTTQDDLQWEALVRRALPEPPRGLPVRYLQGLPLEEVDREVSGLTSSTIGLLLPVNRDGAGRARIPLETMRHIMEASGAPFYSVFSTALGAGAVGGQMTTYADMGRAAGEIVRRILGGETVASISRPRPAPSSFVVDWRELQRWGLDESRLPSGSDVRYKTPTLWQQYKWRIVAAIGLLILQAVSLVALLVQRRRRDLTEAQLNAHRNQLAHLTRVSLVGELSTSLAHELNQPLAAILSNAQAAERFLQVPTPDLEMLREILADISADDRRAGEVIRRLRSLLKKGDPQFQSLQCDEVVGDVLRLMQNDLAAREVVVDTDLPPDLPLVNGDRVQLQQVLLNLIVNAADAVRTLARPERRITVRAVRGEGANIEVTVTDHGSGIATDQLARIFEPFFTTKAEGLGMGLSISRTIVEAHGGRLWATNSPDGGATFHVVLPAISRTPDRAAF